MAAKSLLLLALCLVQSVAAFRVPLAPLQRAQAPLARAAAPPMMKNNKVVRIEVELEDGEPCAPPSPRPARVHAARGPPPGAQT